MPKKFENKIICADAIELLKDQTTPFADLIFADPPFNIGYQYDKYHDKVKKEKYISWTKDWMQACLNVLKPAGSFYIAIGDDYAAYIKTIAEDQLNLTCRNWIIWHYTFGQQTKAKFARAHTHIFYFVKDKKNFTFNDCAVRVPSDRQLIYNDKRANSVGKIPDDVWNNFARVCGTFKERQGWHPCQMPESILMRIIAVSSNPDDLVLDPFSGSGTTAVAAKKLNRKYCGIDISSDYVQNTQKRIMDINKNGNNGQIELPLSYDELDSYRKTELKRLYMDMKLDISQITENEKIMKIFTRQFEIRINDGKKYESQTIKQALREIAN